MESSHKKLERVRKPRVHIKYEVETEGATIVKELPFVIGVLGDFTGDSYEPLKPLKDRKFVQIDRDNLDEIMARMKPGLNFRVENTLNDDSTELAINLKFNALEDFEPAKIIEQVEPLKNLFAMRNKLRDLLTKIDRSEDLENVLEQVLKNSDDLTQLSAELANVQLD